MHHAVLDDHIGGRDLGPSLRLQLREQLFADATVLGLGAARKLVDCHSERLHQVRAAHNSNELAVRTTGTRLIRFASSRRAMSATGVVSVTERTLRVMTSFTWTLCDLM